MRRVILFLLIAATAFGMSVTTGQAASPIREILADRFQLSRIEAHNPVGGGQVTRKGTVLLLEADGIPAKKLRFVQANTKSPRFHVPDYARVDVGRDGRLTAGPGDMALPQGTRLVVLDLEVGIDQVRVFAHTLEPVRLPDGRQVHGCTEFVFAFDPGTLQRADSETVTSRIDQWLSRSAS